MLTDLTADEQKTIDRLLRLAYERVVDGGAWVAAFERTHTESDNKRVYEAWLASRPPDIEMFCRLMCAAYRECEAGNMIDARGRVTNDLLMNRVPQVKAFVDRVPEILVMIRDSMHNNQQLARTIYVLSLLLPEPTA